MIVPMKKTTVVCLAAHHLAVLEAVREAGVLHLQEIYRPVPKPPAGEIERWQQALDILNALPERPPLNPATSPQETADLVLHLHQRIQVLQKEFGEIKAEAARFEPWRGVSQNTLEALQHGGLFLGLCEFPADKTPPEQENILFCPAGGAEKGPALFLALSKQPLPPTLPHLPPPPQALEEMDRGIALLGSQIQQLREELAALAGQRNAFSAALDARVQQLSLARLADALSIHGPLTYFSGFVPAYQCKPLEETAEVHGFGLLISDPAPEDEPPTLLKYPAWIAPVQAVFSAINVLPGYREMDPGAVFLGFFSVFFAMLFGDAGYGLVFLAAVTAVRILRPKTEKKITGLLLLTSVATVVWGALTGVWFGVEVHSGVLESVRLHQLADANFMMRLCFGLGAFHLSVAHGWNILLLFPSTRALAHAGWIVLAWVMFFVAGDWVAGYAMPAGVPAVAVTALLLIALFMTPPVQFKNEWYNHVMLPLSVISHFVDVVSYLRLFAVSAASLAMASAFNSMAMESGFDSALAAAVSALILFGGHTLNIILGAMGVLVHGVRLNTLEFSSHLGVQWSGRPYDPLRTTTVIETNQALSKN